MTLGYVKGKFFLCVFKHQCPNESRLNWKSYGRPCPGVIQPNNSWTAYKPAEGLVGPNKDYVLQGDVFSDLIVGVPGSVNVEVTRGFSFMREVWLNV